MSERRAILRNTRRAGRVGVNGVEGMSYLEPGQEVEVPEELALKLADPSVGLVMTRIEPAKSADKFQAIPRKKRGGG